MSEMLSVRDVSKKYQIPGHQRYRPVLDQLSFDVEQDRITVVVGPSGCGKTTLLNIISGLDTSFDGHIVFGNAHHKIGYMFQTPSLIPWRTVWGNVTVGCEIEHKPESAFASRALGLLKRYGLKEFSHDYPHTLSQGMQQRVAFIRLIIFGANFLLLDEPFARLDPIVRRDLYSDLNSLFLEENVTVLLVTHDIEEAVLLGDKVVILSPRPARFLAEIHIGLDRAQRINYTPGALGEMAPYLAKIWQCLRSGYDSANASDRVR